MATGLSLTLAQTLVAVLDSPLLKEICSVRYKLDLEELKGTISAATALLLDSEAKQEELSYVARGWIEKLKDTLYDLDDLLDEFNTVAQQQRLMASGNNKISEKVRRLLSRAIHLISALSASEDIKKLKEKLDYIASEVLGSRRNFNLQRRRRAETCSYVREDDIIGRDGDKEVLVSMLLESTVEDISFVTIVGMGGLGKTTLAQLVFNDDRIRSEFQLRLWVCVSEEFGVKEVLRGMIRDLARNSRDETDDLDLDQMSRKVRQHLETKRYLLVLDDVWNDSADEWVMLKDFLIELQGKKGSKILVTSRSHLVAKAIGEYPMYKLEGLSEEDSLKLFKSCAIPEEKGHTDDLVELSKDIVKKCANVPLAIRVMGAMLYGQDRHKWYLIQNHGFKDMEANAPVAVLKFSYLNLCPPMRSCFSYCALFPKDHVMDKNDLVNLWMAHGCIVPLEEGQSMEDAAEEYISVLLQRCFFQGIEKDDNGLDVSFQLHDLMHDLALEAAGQELFMLSSTKNHLDRKIRHLSLDQSSILNSLGDFLAGVKMLRTFLQIGKIGKELICQSNATRVILTCTGLRWLDLCNASLTTIPSGIDGLIHLRCLNLSGNYKLQMLPESIANLVSLQILKLRECYKLQALPKHFSRLVNLRHLDIYGCDALACMPTGLKKLTRLHRLTMFIVGGHSEQVQMSHLEDLKALANLRGRLDVKVVTFCSNEISEVREAAYLSNKPYIQHLDVEFKPKCQADGDVQEALLEGFQPTCNLTFLRVACYKGMKFAGWNLRENVFSAFFSRLVTVTLEELSRVQDLPLLSQLRRLKDLSIRKVPNLEYMESDRSYAPSLDSAFFPSLEVLELSYLSKLKGWWRDGVMVDLEAHGSASDGSVSIGERDGANGCLMPSLIVFPRLHELLIGSCPKLTSFPPCPRLRALRVLFSEVPLFKETRGRVDNHNHMDSLCTTIPGLSLDIGVASAGKDSCRVKPPIFSLEKLTTDNPRLVYRLPKMSVQELTRLEIMAFERDLSGTRDVFRSCASSLQVLEISYANHLRTLRGGGIEHLTCLQSLSINSADELKLEDEVEDEMPWISLHNLSSLTLAGLPQMVNLPSGLQYLTALQSLTIDNCNNLTALPRWLSRLTSLRSVNIKDCRNLALSEAMLGPASSIKVTITEEGV